MRRIAGWVIVYAIAMAFVEAAVVVYLRALAHGGPFIGSALPILPHGVVAIEVAREAATLIMLAAVATVAGRDARERFLWFWLAFAVWDLGYYGWLRVLAGWPPSLLAWDVLFLIPVPWTAPVLAPVLVSLGMIAGVLLALRLHTTAQRLGSRALLSIGLVLGGALMFTSFVMNYRIAIAGQEPGRFNWILFSSGYGIATAGVVLGVLQAKMRGIPTD